jgi:hypothetical protein
MRPVSKYSGCYFENSMYSKHAHVKLQFISGYKIIFEKNCHHRLI